MDTKIIIFFKTYFGLILSVFVALMLVIIVGASKRVTFCDEVYTYTIVNSNKTMIQLEQGRWIDHKEISNMLTHNNDDSLRQLFVNVKGDSHPPLYYSLVYIVASLFPDTLSPWIALSVNGLIYLSLVGLIWFVLREFFSGFEATVAVIICSFNIAVISNMSLLRMYILMTLFAVLFAFFMMKIFENPSTKKWYVWLGIATAGGFLTQYYFSFFAISFFVVFTVYCFVSKNKKYILWYLVSMITAVLFDTIIWRFWIPAVFMSPDSETINANASSITDIFSDFFNGFKMVQGSLFQRYYIFGTVAFVILCVSFFAIKKVREKNKAFKWFVISLIGVLILYSGITYKITPEYLISTRYFYVVDVIELTIIALIIVAFTSDFINKKALKLVVAGVLFIFNTVVFFSGLGIDYYADAKEYDSGYETLKEYSELPWVICGPETWQIDTNFFDYMIPERLMMISDEIECADEALFEGIDEFIIVGNGSRSSNNSDDALYYYIGSTGKFAGSTFILERYGLSYYIAHSISE